MAIIDIEQLSTALDGDDPCGPDLEYLGINELEQKSAGKPERQAGNETLSAEEPDWRDVRDYALELAQRTRDLRVAATLCVALFRTNGWQGLVDGLTLLEALLRSNWQGVHPKLDPSDGNDPMMRISALSVLLEPTFFLRAVRATPIVVSRGLGTASFRDLQLARGDIQPRPGENPPDAAAIDAIFLSAEDDSVAQSRQLLDAAVQRSAAIDAIFEENGAGAVISDFGKLLCDVARAFHGRVALRGPAAASVETAEAVSEAASPVAGVVAIPMPPRGTVTTREDVVATIDRLVEYFERNEPSSPIPVLLLRARSLVGKDFRAIVDDLVPAARDQLEIFRGPS